jgi:transposase InsO family protein
VKFAWMEKHLADFPVAEMGRVLGVQASGFHAWQQREPGVREQRRTALAVEIKAVHAHFRGVYGAPRIQRELHKQAVQVCENTVAAIMRQLGLRSKRARTFVPSTTDSKHAHPVAPNTLDREFIAERPNQKWVTDITYVETKEGWLYVAAVLDLYSRKIVGWSMAEHLRAELVLDALSMALARRRPGAGLLHHSDRGVQYACGEYRRMLKENGMECSMSRTGNCYDNAVMESFWSTLKTELVYHENYATRGQARHSIFEYMEVFYNRHRMHSSIGYISPEAFEAALN